MSIDVVIPYCEGQRLLDAIVVALDRQIDPLSGRPFDHLTITIADDASPLPPRTTSQTATANYPISVVRLDTEGYHPASARNLGARERSGDIIVFLDGDTVPSPSYIAHLVGPIRSGVADVTTGHRRHGRFDGLSPTEIADFVASPTDDRLLDEPSWLRDGLERTDRLRDGSPRTYEYVISATLAVGRSLFESTGGFDETFDSYGGEDWEFAYRCWNAGGRFEHVPAAIAVHDGPDVEGRAADERAKVIESIRIAELVPTSPTRLRGLSYRVPMVDITLELSDEHPAANAIAAWSILSSDLRDLRLRLTGSSAAVDLIAAECGDPRLVVGGHPDPRARYVVQVAEQVSFRPHTLDALLDDLGAGRLNSRVVRDASMIVVVASSVRAQHTLVADRGRGDATDVVSAADVGIDRIEDRSCADWARRRTIQSGNE